MAPANFQHRIINSPASKLNVSDDDGQLANLYWHTHGSTFWQHLLNNTEPIDSI